MNGAKVCRFGSSVSLRQLRQGFRYHRFEAGVVGLASDPLHQGLLEGLPGLLHMPMRFRPASQWGHLVREAVVDAALVSSLELEAPPSAIHPPGERNGDGGREDTDPPPPDQVHLGQWPLALALSRATHRLEAPAPMTRWPGWRRWPPVGSPPPCPPLREHLWLLLPGDWRRLPVLQRTVADLLHLAEAAGAQPEAPSSGRDEEVGLQRAC